MRRGEAAIADAVAAMVGQPDVGRPAVGKAARDEERQRRGIDLRPGLRGAACVGDIGRMRNLALVDRGRAPCKREGESESEQALGGRGMRGDRRIMAATLAERGGHRKREVRLQAVLMN